MRIVCLLPARNAAQDLPRWLDSVAVFCDAVVALDDGSTDATADVLASHPLVKVLLRNPRRTTYAGWDDSSNRRQLLSAAAELAPDWVVSVDADEIIPPEDGRALREFVEHRALPGFAYGFPVFRMIDDVDHYDVIESRAYRLFAYRPHQQLADARLHFVPVPTDIPRHRWVVTNVRLQHLGTLTPELRQARREKYREADPEQQWEDNYSYIDAPAGARKRFAPRPPGQPVVLECRFGWDAAEREGEFDGPVASAVVIVDETTVDAMSDVLDALAHQASEYPVEILVLARGSDVADDIARMQPSVMVAVIPERSSPGEARNLGLRLAPGDYVVFFDAPAVLAPGALAAMVEAHDAGRTYVAGNVRNLTPSAVGWSSYFDDPAHGSFSRAPLLRAGGFNSEVPLGVEALARARLLRAGEHVAHNALITFGHRTDVATARDYLRARFALGRASANGPVANRLGPTRPTGAEELAAYERVAGLRRQGAAAERAGSRWAQLRSRWGSV
jgi:glycosyltransferase involved in cell wall biosynthesis